MVTFFNGYAGSSPALPTPKKTREGNMAKVKEISVTYARTVNLGNFESMRIEMGEVVALGDLDVATIEREAAFKYLKNEVSAIVKAVKEKQAGKK